MIYVKKYTEYFYVNVYFKTLIFFKQLLQKNPLNHACQPHIKMFPGVNPALMIVQHVCITFQINIKL